MAELSDATAAEERSRCCSPESSSCGCSAGQSDTEEVRDAVRARYAAAATSVDSGEGCCATATVLDDEQAHLFGAGLYGGGERSELPDTATMASLGCGNPTAVAELAPGEIVLDLGAGGGIDVLLSARRVGPTGKAYGLDMTDEMLALARESQRKAGVENVEAARVLKPSGRFAVSDVIADEGMDEANRADMAQWAGCIAGALTRAEFEQALFDAGLLDVEITETHRVHDDAGSAIVRARKPVSPA